MATPTMAEIKAAITAASDSEKAAFKRVLGVTDTSAPDRSSPEAAAAAQRALQLEIDRAEVMEQAAKLNNDFIKADQERNKLLKLQLEDELRRQNFTEQEIAKTIKKAELGQTITGLNETHLQQAKQLAEAFRDSNKELEDRKRILEDIQGGVDATVGSMAGLIGLEDKYSKSKISGMTNLFSIIQKGGANGKAATDALVKSFQNMFSLQNIGMNVAGAIFDQSMKTLKAYDDASASLAKTTGTVGKFNNVLYDSQRAGNLLGVSMKDVAGAITALNSGTSAFAKLNESTQTQLAISTSQFERLGVSAQDTAAFMENAFKIMNMGAT